MPKEIANGLQSVMAESCHFNHNRNPQRKHSNARCLIILLMFIPVNVRHQVSRKCGISWLTESNKKKKKTRNAMFNCWSAHPTFSNCTNVLAASLRDGIREPTECDCVHNNNFVNCWKYAPVASPAFYILLPSSLARTLTYVLVLVTDWIVDIASVSSRLLLGRLRRNDHTSYNTNYNVHSTYSNRAAHTESMCNAWQAKYFIFSSSSSSSCLSRIVRVCEVLLSLSHR